MSNPLEPKFTPLPAVEPVFIDLPADVPAGLAVVHRDFTNPVSAWSESAAATTSATDREALAAFADVA